MTPPLFVTGTDTGVGKSTVAAALLRAWRRQGKAVVGFKPAESGCVRSASGALLAADGALLAAAAGLEHLVDLVCPLRYEAPVAPRVASLREGRPFSIRGMITARAELAARAPHDLLVVEGAGGLLVPYADAVVAADLAGALSARLLIVARASLGTINHTALTVEAARARGLEVVGVVLSCTTAIPDAAFDDNAHEITRLTGVAVLGTLGHLGADADAGAAIARALDLDALWARATAAPSPSPAGG